MEEFAEIATKAAWEAGVILNAMRGAFAVRAKSPRDLVTEVDLSAQHRIESIIREHFPSHGFLGEESSPEARAAAAKVPYVWVVDPLDGTTNYIHGFPFFCVSIALLHEGRPITAVILDPFHSNLYRAVRGKGSSLNGNIMRTRETLRLADALVATSFASEVSRDSPEVENFLTVLPHAQALRRVGSTALNLANVATGQLDGYWATTCHPWDIAAGVLLVEESGGKVTGWDGGELMLLEDSRVVATSTVQLHTELRCYLMKS